ncbi:MAG: Stp1/IreP family PP2C-type Ser/Thr phosphatase [Halofilum sp. (in: g-proteobacteria)]|nr:Stp1/IreP family PP2C-type Ser/Thr phosphatase [Halofilum sp. (in: g-proteobacteria)]
MAGGGKRRPDLSEALEIVERTDVGRRRDHNEDCVGSDAAHGIAALADGMGGHNAGEVASGMAIESVLRDLPERLDTLVEAEENGQAWAPESLVAGNVLEQSNRAIHEAASNQPQYQGMGTTVVVAVFYDDRLTIAHVGDSRVYRLRDGALEQLTRDHTLLQELVDRGFYTYEEARQSLNRNIVTRALGVEPEVKVDLQEEIALPGDLYLLCSDGLNDMLDDEVIRLTLTQFGANLDEAADRLVDRANEQGGADNISVVLVRVVKSYSSRQSWFRRIVDWFQ